MQNSVIREPLSGAVTQLINANPVTQLTSNCLQQMGFINVNYLGSTNHELEDTITREIAGYGQQLGWILETLVMVIDKLKRPLGPMTEDEEKKIMRLKNLLDDIRNMKKALGAA